MTPGPLRFVLAFLLLASAAHAQVVASLRLAKTQHVAGEPVIAIVTLTNHAGRDLVFQNSGRSRWLDFLVRSPDGNNVTSPSGGGNFGALKIGAGQSMAREVDLTQHFHLTEPGNFSVAAVVRAPGGVGDDVATNRVIFTLNPGRNYWSQKVGISSKPGQTREFRILTFNGEQKSQLYAQVIDNSTGRKIRTFQLGDSLSIRKPTVTIDRTQRLHVLFLATPSIYVHCQVDADGRLVKRDFHQRAGQGDPMLMTSGKGEVAVGNSIPYDPKAIEAQRRQTRKASDRPAFIYE